jgi:phosphoribosylglycinamide formyltransferase-1
MIKAFPEKIVNIHPALLPKYGGKGMYGARVHKAVLEAKEKESGISIHLVNEKYDEGKIISQHTSLISENDTAETLAQKIHQLEHVYYPIAIEKLLLE